MMIDKRLIGTVADSKKYIAGNVISQWISLAANICMMGAIAQMLQHLYEGAIGERLRESLWGRSGCVFYVLLFQQEWGIFHPER